MGFLTTICFRNDAYSSFEKNPKETVDNILSAMSGGEIEGVGYHGNPMVAMTPSHADVERLFVQTGNSLFEIGYSTTIRDISYYKEILKRAKRAIAFAEKEIRNMESQ